VKQVILKTVFPEINKNRGDKTNDEMREEFAFWYDYFYKLLVGEND